MDIRKSTMIANVAILVALLTGVSIQLCSATTPGYSIGAHECFIENKGQFPSEVLYKASAPGMCVWVCRDGLSYDLRGTSSPTGRKIHRPSKYRSMYDEYQDEIETQHHVVKLSFVGASVTTTLPSAQRVHEQNYFLGSDAASWQSHVASFQNVTMKNVYEGIDVQLSYAGTQPRFDFIVSPGASPNSIQLKADGATAQTIDADGALRLKTSCGDIVQGSIYAYQNIGGHNIQVSCRFRQQGDHIGFDLGSYDNRYQLVIDPTVYATYVGAEDVDMVTSLVRVPSTSNVVAVGYTSSSSFPHTTGAYKSSNIGAEDVFVMVLDASLSTIISSSLIGGGSTDIAWGAALSHDGKNNLFVCGETASSNFPTTSGVVSQLFRGAIDAFVFEINAAGDKLVFSTYHGGTGDDRAYSITVDDGGNCYYCGETNSSNFTVKAGSFKTTAPGSGDGFAASLSPGAGLFNYATFIGGSNKDRCTDIAFSGTSDASMVVVGETKSTDFPLAPNTWGIPQCAQIKLNGTGIATATDAFMTKLNPRGADLIYSTYMGANGDDYATAVAVDVVGVATVGGSTLSTNLPTIGEFQSSKHPKLDGFLCQVKADGSNFPYISYIGGNGNDYIHDLTINSGYIYAVGESTSNDLPTTSDAWQQTTQEGLSGFVFKMRPNAMVYGSYIGGQISDQTNCICLVDDFNGYVGGMTSSTFIGVSDSAAQRAYSGSSDGYVSRVCFSNLILASPQQSSSYCAGSPVIVTWTATQLPANDPFMLEYSPDNGVHWTTVKTTLTNHTYTWIIPTATASTTQGKLRVTHQASGFSALNTGNFNISNPPLIQKQSGDTSLCAGESLKLIVQASGDGLQYQWRKDGQSIGGATEPSWTIPSFSASDAGSYELSVSGSCGQTKISNPIAVHLLRAPAITADLSDLTLLAHSKAVFSVAASGTHLHYRWQKYKANLNVADSSSLVLNDISMDDYGRYRVIVSGDCGADTSAEVYLTVNVDNAVPSDERIGALGLQVYPNPTASSVVLRSTQPGLLSSEIALSARVENGVGELLGTAVVFSDGVLRADLSSLPPGMYFIGLHLSTGLIRVPVIVLH